MVGGACAAQGGHCVSPVCQFGSLWSSAAARFLALRAGKGPSHLKVRPPPPPQTNLPRWPQAAVGWVVLPPAFVSDSCSLARAQALAVVGAPPLLGACI